MISRGYWQCVRVIDYRHIVPCFSEWSETVHLHAGCERDVLFWTDGKPRKFSHPGTGEAAQNFAAVVGMEDVNLVQQAFYSRHYHFHGAKVQHVVEANGMMYSLSCPLRRHEAVVLQESAMLVMFSVLTTMYLALFHLAIN